MPTPQKARGVMYKPPLVRAILEDRKLVTRRPMNPQPAPGHGVVNAAHSGDRHLWNSIVPRNEAGPSMQWRCPYGKVGDLIYVRETWVPNTVMPLEHRPEGDYLYAATDAEKYAVARWKPSIHMPKKAARIWLRITGVRAERLHDMSDESLALEGIQEYVDQGKGHDGTHRDAFRQLWNTTGGDWEANPWVWVIEFERVTD